MSDVSRKAVKRTLNHINEQQVKTNELLEKSVAHQTKMKGLPVEDQLKRLVVIDAVGNVEPVDVDDLMRDIAELYDVVSKSNEQVADAVKGMASEVGGVANKVADNKLELPELQKISGEVTLSNAKEIAKEISKLIPVPEQKDMPEEMKISNLPDKQEVFGKALVKLDGNTEQNPVAVRLTDGKKFVDLEELFKVSVSTGAGGGGGVAEADKVGLVTEQYDYIALTYVSSGNGAGEVETATYKTGGSGGTTVATLTLTYNSDDEIESVTKT